MMKGSVSTVRKRILVVANPTAGSARSARLAGVLGRLEHCGCSVTIHETEARGDAERMAATADRARFDVIAAAGGDGTINEVLNGLKQDGPPLAILPLGTVNVLATEIGLATSIDAIAETIVCGPIRRVSLGEVNGRRFAVMASVGFDATIVEKVDLDLKRHIGKWAYLYEILKQFLLSTPSNYHLRNEHGDGEAQGVIIANGRHYAGRYVAAPAADLEKPRLDVCRLMRRGRLAVPGYMLSMVLGRLAEREDYQISEAVSLEILGPAGAPLQADGDLVCRLPATIRVLPDAVDLIFPSSAPAAMS